MKIYINNMKSIIKNIKFFIKVIILILLFNKVSYKIKIKHIIMKKRNNSLPLFKVFKYI